MAGIDIREVEPKDNAKLANIIRRVFIEHDAPQEGTVFTDPTTDSLYQLFEKEGAVLYVADLDGHVVGCGGIYPTQGLPSGYAEFVKFYIAPQARGIQIGKQMMEQSTEFARNRGYTHLYIESLPHYAKAVKMYKKQGYVVLDDPLGQSGHSTCNIWMLKEL